MPPSQRFWLLYVTPGNVRQARSPNHLQSRRAGRGTTGNVVAYVTAPGSAAWMAVLSAGISFCSRAALGSSQTWNMEPGTGQPDAGQERASPARYASRTSALIDAIVRSSVRWGSTVAAVSAAKGAFRYASMNVPAARVQMFVSSMRW